MHSQQYKFCSLIINHVDSDAIHDSEGYVHELDGIHEWVSDELYEKHPDLMISIHWLLYVGYGIMKYVYFLPTWMRREQVGLNIAIGIDMLKDVDIYFNYKANGEEYSNSLSSQFMISL